MSLRYEKSETALDLALKTIPLGAQTFSKSRTQFPFGVSPYFADRALGAHLWDIDGNEYIDFINALASVILGYVDPDVTQAVKIQADLGSIYSLSSPLEQEVAELICTTVPSAEMVRFGKNGSDATAGAIRVARAYTGRDYVLTCGYHGWQDWYIGSTARHKGVPKAVRDLTRAFAYNDLGSLRQQLDVLDGQVAAVILEPMNVVEPQPGFLEGVQALTKKAGAVLIFDETVTGYRLSLGGAQELFGVTPDLTTLGKALANGHPLSAICGRRELMMEMEEIFFSFTMGGETLSLAAAKATITKLMREPVLATIKSLGAYTKRRVQELIHKHRLENAIKLSGDPSWSFLSFQELDGITSWEMKTLFVQEVFAHGILTLGSHNMSYAHTTADIDRLVSVYDSVFALIADAIKNRSIRQYLKCAPLVPLFRVR